MLNAQYTLYHESDHTMNRKKFLYCSTAGFAGIGITGCSTPGLLKRTSQSDTIQYRKLGKTGLKVTAVGFGATRTNEPSVIKRVVDTGVNFIDTGRMYSEGKNEEVIGKVIADIRKDIVIQSKIHQNIQRNKTAMEKSIDESLKALRTDYIDVMLLRWTSDKEAVNNPVAIEVLDRAKESGKIRCAGISCHSNQVEIMKAAIENAFYDVVLVTYNYAGKYTHVQSGRKSEWDAAALEREILRASSIGMGVVAMKTCSAGPLKEEGESEATYTAALRWILRNKNISTIIPAMGNFREIEEDVRAMYEG